MPQDPKPHDDAAQLRLIADNMPVMSIAYDKHLRCLFANRRFAEFFGFTTASIVGKHLREIIGEAGYLEIKPHFDRVLDGHRTTYKRNRVLASGELRNLEVELIPHLADDGSALALFAVTSDVTERLREQQQLLDSEARFRSLTAMSSDFYWETDAEHRLTLISPRHEARQVPTLRQPPRVGELRWEIPYLSPDAAGWELHRQTLDSHQPFRRFSYSRLGIDGSERHLWISGDPIFDAAGDFKGYRGVGGDYTASKQAEQAQRHAAEELRLFADNVPAMTVSFDQDLRCRFVNKAYAAFFQIAAADIFGRHARDIAGAAVYGDIEHHFASAMQGQAVSYHRTQQLPSGEERHLDVKLLPHIEDSGKVSGIFSVVTDVTEYKLAEERIRHMAHHDGLTGLPNRRLLNDRLSHELRRARRGSHEFGLLYLDLDRFKAVNDSFGHALGDELLQAVATRIQQHVRESDTVARVGGDEFTIIVPTIAGRDEVATVAAKLVRALSTPFQLGNERVEIGASIGIAIYPGDGADADALISAADAAMYGAKRLGNCYRFASP